MAALVVSGLRGLWRGSGSGLRHRQQLRQPSRGHKLTPMDDEMYQKTTITLLERDSPETMFIENYSSNGFLINGDRVIGPCAVIPRAVLQWNVSPEFNYQHPDMNSGSYKDITEDSLALFHLLEPKIEILVLGLGHKVERVDPQVLRFIRRKGIAVEIQDTANACATFNFLTSDRRMAAAALIPPSYLPKKLV
ncbi:NADH dehydrogenase [ubiquinone] 1 alpha subcomplex assembly factor 3 isoform X2 [Callorhinchus milii]|uniref:NADH dehydrogenase [ubiquinone] 1 alpha subcomplex assembly factor 3 isoform X2 n=1 Tax=Callorhinchus milii TaxID=7868 RepID=UPI001C3FF0C9|nr:NADH dehydrogenase [ubiquinone] 1 alpha subcomplex assembly factor 3 isoform X2 [Callorhinchus milii]